MTINIRKLKGTLALCVCIGLFSALAPSDTPAQTTAFTYQGKLADNGADVNGLYDFTMTLWDAGTNGTQIGPTLNLVNRQVTDGIFTLTLNFGPGVFTGQFRFLEISLKPSGSSDPPTVLSPRQLVVSAPYAIKSLGSISADSLSVACANCITAGQILSVNGGAIIGSIPLSALPPGSANYIQNGATEQPSSTFNISGIGRASTFDAATQFSIGGNRILGNAGFNNLFAGVAAGLSNTTGDNNSFYGQQTGTFNTSGNGNSFFGSLAGQANNTGSENSFFGRGAGFSNTIGSGNSYFGSNAGRLNVGGNNNSFFGLTAGSGTIGSDNAFFGANAGKLNTNGANNSFFGSSSGVNNSASNNSFFGKSAGASNTTGANNAFLGADSGASNVSGSNNSFFGRSSGLTNTTGSLNAFFGTEAGSANVAGGGNSFFGWRAGFSNTSNGNSFFGKAAGTNNSTGFNNSFFGWETGFNNKGNNNAFFGVSAGFANDANDNSLFGASAGSSNTTGFLNTFVGRSAGSVNTTGRTNTFVGSETGASNTIGIDNVFVGHSAGELNTNGGGNSFIGVNAGKNNVTGQFNTIIGADADVYPPEPNLTNATAIGSRAVVGQSNSLVLGSINGVNGATADTKVGIGTIAPSYPLTIRTAGNVSGGLKGWVHTDDIISLGSKVGGTGGQPFGGWIGTITNHPLSFFVNNSTTPSLTLETSGFIRLNGLDSGGGTALCLTNLNLISFCSSSLRYKTDVQSFMGGLNIIDRLRPITFTWKEGGMRDVGFGAEEVEKVEPLLTFKNPKGQIEGVKYSQISAVLVNAIKEQQTQIAEQRNQIESLETIRSENAQLKAQLAAISARLQRMERRLNVRR